MTYPRNHAIVRYHPGKMSTIVFFPLMTERPNMCPTVTLTGTTSVAGHHGMHVYDSTYPAQANEESMIVYRQLNGSKGTRINSAFHQAILNGVGTGDMTNNATTESTT